jgi:hypothetical protein
VKGGCAYGGDEALGAIALAAAEQIGPEGIGQGIVDGILNEDLVVVLQCDEPDAEAKGSDHGGVVGHVVELYKLAASHKPRAETPLMTSRTMDCATSACQARSRR